MGIHPKILLIDIEDEALEALTDKSFNARAGTYGVPYHQTQRNDRLRLNYDLPNFAEQEIIAIDLSLRAKTWTDAQIAAHSRIDSRPVTRGVVDPVQAAMEHHRPLADRILANGGVFVVFAAPPRSAEYVGQYSHAAEDTWEFISWRIGKIEERSHIQVIADAGNEITVTAQGVLGRILRRHLQGAYFTCTIGFAAWVKNAQFLAESKYRVPVAALVAGNPKGLVLIVPQIRDKTAFLIDLLTDYLPEVCPHLFESSGASKWPTEEPYELEPASALKARIAEIIKGAREHVATLNKEIESVRADQGYLHDILIQTGAPLVVAVKKALESIGFKKVVDLDNEDPDADLNEDLQVWDLSPTLLVEVKGLGGAPTDEAALQAQKYVAPRMKEWNRTDVQALSIINHERNKPALDRENDSPFRSVILENARKHGFGLMTTWDLYRLARSFLRNGWNPEHVKPVFYQTGRIAPVPTHYEEVGRIERFIEKLSVVGIQTGQSQFKNGDRLAFELPTYFQEETVTSIQVDNSAVDETPSGALVGVQTALTKDEAKTGVRVFVVRA